MHKNRLEAFSDGVLAIIITIMVLELKVPHGGQLADLLPIVAVLLSYILSFIYLAIYWNNHHHLLHTVKQVNAGILWANMHLLFWLSLIPFTTAWMGENHFQKWPVLLYGVVLLAAAIAYFILSHVIIATHGKESVLAKAIGKDIKGKISIVFYVLGIIFAGMNVYLSLGVYVIVAIMWLVPDQRIERRLID
jgi:uncharacterized membrane protein